MEPIIMQCFLCVLLLYSCPQLFPSIVLATLGSLTSSSVGWLLAKIKVVPDCFYGQNEQKKAKTHYYYANIVFFVNDTFWLEELLAVLCRYVMLVVLIDICTKKWYQFGLYRTIVLQWLFDWYDDLCMNIPKRT